MFLLLILRVLPTGRATDHTPPGATPRALAPPITRETVAGPTVGAHAAVVGRHCRSTARRVVRHRSGTSQIDIGPDTARLSIPAAGPVPSATATAILPVAAGIGQSPVSAAPTTTGAGPPLPTRATQPVRLSRRAAPPARLLPSQP